MCKKEKEILIKSFVYSNFNYCPLVWFFFFSKTSMRKTEKIQERYLRMVLDEYESKYDALLPRSGESILELRRLPTLAIEIFKTVNNQNSGFMGEMFYRSLYVSHKKQNLFVQSHKTTAFGDKRLKMTWPSNTEFIPEKIRSVPNLVEVKNSIKIWFDPKCMCN